MGTDGYKSRKFWLAIVSLASGILALFIGKLDGGSYVALVSLILGIYGTANVAEKAATKQVS